MKQYSYCINCGKHGHINYQCKLPIISIGIIPYSIMDGKLKYLMINRKDTLGYVDFMRGKYALDDIDCIQRMLNEMTVEEHHRLLTLDFDELWKQLWNIDIVGKYRTEEIVSKERLSKLKEGILIDNVLHTLLSLIEGCKDKWTEPEWGFPKGRREVNERDLECGLREFMEETGYNSKNVQIIQNMLPYDEIFIGSNYKGYKHKYFVGYISNTTVPDKPYQTSEVRNMLWLTYEELLTKIRYYDLEKIDIINKVNKVLMSYRVFL